MSTVTKIGLSLSNAYLIQGNRPILVDSGAPGEETKIISALAKQGVDVADLSLIAHTHVHSDHVGSTNALIKHSTIPTAFHAADQHLADQGHNGPLEGAHWRGSLMTFFFKNAQFAAPSPTFYFQDGMRLDEYGVAGQILHTPGHTAGSISFLLDSGDAIVGDVLMGGYMGGNLLPTLPNIQYFAENLEQVHNSIDKLLQSGAHTFYVGHGGPLSAERISKRFKRSAARSKL